jgi:hypothetical protein
MVKRGMSMIETRSRPGNISMRSLPFRRTPRPRRLPLLPHPSRNPPFLPAPTLPNPPPQTPPPLPRGRAHPQHPPLPSHRDPHNWRYGISLCQNECVLPRDGPHPLQLRRIRLLFLPYPVRALPHPALLIPHSWHSRRQQTRWHDRLRPH